MNAPPSCVAALRASTRSRKHGSVTPSIGASSQGAVNGKELRWRIALVSARCVPLRRVDRSRVTPRVRRRAARRAAGTQAADPTFRVLKASRECDDTGSSLGGELAMQLLIIGLVSAGLAVLGTRLLRTGSPHRCAHYGSVSPSRSPARAHGCCRSRRPRA